MDNDLHARIRRLYAATGEAVEHDLTKFPTTVVSGRTASGSKLRGFFQDFSGGRSEAEISNSLHSLIALVAGLEYHLRKWAAHNGKSAGLVQETFNRSDALKIVHDLWNNDKHGYPPLKRNGKSGRAPRLESVHRVMQLRAEKNSWAMIRIDRHGKPVKSGDGTAQVVITGDVIDLHGAKIGNVDTILARAVQDCEELLRAFGIKP